MIQRPLPMRLPSFPIILCLLFLSALPTVARADAAQQRYESALGAFERGDVATATIQLKNLLLESPGHLPGQVLLGRAYLRAGDAAGAEKQLRKAADMGADPSLIAVPLATALIMQERYQAVLDDFDPKDYPEGLASELLSLRGDALLALDRAAEAEASYAEAERRDATALAPLLGRARARLALGDTEGAEALARAAVARDGKHAPAWYLLGTVLHTRGDAGGAAHAYDTALELQPEFDAVRFARITLDIDTGRLDAALEALDRLAEAQPAEPRVQYLRAVVLNRLGDSDRALAALKEAGAIFQRIPPKALATRPAATLLAGVVHYSLGEFGRAEAELQRYLGSHPRHLGARKLLGQLRLQQQRPHDAVAVLEPALREGQSDPELLTLLGSAYLATGREASAAELLTKAAGAGFGHARERLALYHLAQGRIDSALLDLRPKAGPAPDSLQARLLRLVLELRTGALDDADATARALVDDYPTHPLVHNLAGVARLARGDAASARKAFEAALALDAEFVPAHINLARLDLAAGHADVARARIDRLLATHAEHPGLLVERSRIALAEKDTGTAGRLLEKAFALDETRPDTAVALARFRLARGEVEAAGRALARALRSHPDDVELNLAQADVQAAGGDTAAARATLERLSRAVTGTGLQEVARRQAAIGDLAGAIWSLERQVGDPPEMGPAALQLIDYRLAAGRVAPALRLARELRKRAPEDPDLLRALGLAELAGGERAAAVRHLRRALGLRDDARNALALYRALTAAQGSAAARRWLADWVTRHPQADDARLVLAEALFAEGDHAGAAAQLERLLEHHPDDPRLLNNLATVRLLLGEADAARALAERAVALRPEDPRYLDTLGWALVEAGQPERALAPLRQAHARRADLPDIRYHLGRALEALGRMDEARAEYRAALASDQPFPGRDDARKRLGRPAP